MIMHWEVKAMKRTLVWLLVATLLLTALPAAAEEAATSDVYRTLYSGEITTLNYLVTTTTNDFAISDAIHPIRSHASHLSRSS